MPVKKSKRGGKLTSQDTGFDATPPDDGIDIADEKNRNQKPRQNTPMSEGKKGLKKLLDSYTGFLQKSFRNTPRYQQEAYINRFAQIVCIGIAVVILQSFYSVLLKEVRIISLPLLVGAAWFIANRLVTPAIIKRMGNYMNEN
jgi:hypothetical protein